MKKKDLAPAPFWGIALAFGIMYVAWGTTYLATQKGVRDEHLPVYLFGGTRIGTAGLILLLFQAFRGKPLAPRLRELPGLLGISFLLFVLGNGLIARAQRTVDSGMAAVLVATTPLWIGLLAMLWPGGERLRPRGWLGLGVGLLGVLCLLSPRLTDLDVLLSDLGPLLILVSAVCWAAGSLFLRHRPRSSDHLSSAAHQMICGGLLMLLTGLAIGETDQLPDHITSGAVFAFTYLLIVGSLLGYVAFHWLLAHVPASKVGTYSYVNPVIAVFVGWFDNEPVTAPILAGIGVILLGVFLVRQGDKPEDLPGDEEAGDVPVIWTETTPPYDSERI